MGIALQQNRSDAERVAAPPPDGVDWRPGGILDDLAEAPASNVPVIIGAALIGLASLGWIGAVAVAWVPSLMSVMMFDSPSAGGVLVNLAFYAMFTFPYVAVGVGIFLLLATATSLVAAFAAWPRTARLVVAVGLLVGAVPLLNVVLGGLAFVGIQAFCGGSFQCF